jgi:hypothetical protein
MALARHLSLVCGNSLTSLESSTRPSSPRMSRRVPPCALVLRTPRPSTLATVLGSCLTLGWRAISAAPKPAATHAFAWVRGRVPARARGGEGRRAEERVSPSRSRCISATPLGSVTRTDAPPRHRSSKDDLPGPCRAPGPTAMPSVRRPRRGLKSGATGEGQHAGGAWGSTARVWGACSSGVAPRLVGGRTCKCPRHHPKSSRRRASPKTISSSRSARCRAN